MLRKIGEEATETLDYVPGRFKVVQHVREALSCRNCETVVQTPAPHHPIARGRAGAGLLAHIIVSKFDDICRCIARPRFTLVRASSWRPRRYRDGSVHLRPHWRRFLRCCGVT